METREEQVFTKKDPPDLQMILYKSDDSISNNTPSRVACSIGWANYHDRMQVFVKQRVGPGEKDISKLEDNNNKILDGPVLSLKVGPLEKEVSIMGPKSLDCNFHDQLVDFLEDNNNKI